MDISKIYLPQGSSLSSADVEDWLSNTKIYTEKFLQLNKSYIPPSIDYIKNAFALDPKEYIASNNCNLYVTNMWSEHISRLNERFLKNPYQVLNDDLVRYAIYLTCANEFLKTQLPYLKNIYSEIDLKNLLLECPGLFPTIVDSCYLTSESRVNHLTHLSYAENILGIKISQLNKIVEFGAGYGSMTDLIRRLNSGHTHIVIDLPELLLIQSYYLLGRYQKEAINFITTDDKKIKEGKINLCPINLLNDLKIENVDLFIATWSLSEANELTQKLIVKDFKFFNSKNILYGYRKYLKTNTRQPCSKALDISLEYNILEDSPCFWTLNNENNYQIARKI
jgi:hypothetical protein